MKHWFFFLELDNIETVCKCKLKMGIKTISCKDKEDPEPVDTAQAEKTEVLKTYADIAHANYSDALSDAKALTGE